MYEPEEQPERPGPPPDRPPSAGLDGLESVPPGAALAALLATVDPAGIADAYQLVEVAAACQRLKGWAEAIEVQTAAALAGHPICRAEEAARHGFSPIRAAGQLLAPRLGQSPTAACNRVATAVQLVDELTDTVTALSNGQIDYPKAAALAAGVRSLDPPDGCRDRYTGEPITLDGIRRGLVTASRPESCPRPALDHCTSTGKPSPARSPPSPPRPPNNATNTPATNAGSDSARSTTGWPGSTCMAQRSI